MLFHQAGEQRLDDSRSQKDEHKIGGNAAGGMIFLNLGHGSSQGLGFGGDLPPTDPRAGLYMVGPCGKPLAPRLATLPSDLVHKLWLSIAGRN